jgi:asparagine synthase (glutamine-hydrolysing)
VDFVNFNRSRQGLKNMCGILGIVSLSGKPIDVAALQRMNDLQTHRGPDGQGFLMVSLASGKAEYVSARLAADWGSKAGPQVALGHRRLAILDLSERGAQPMTVGESRTWIVFNGEIYNHRELRAELEMLGYAFATRTDTEVLLQCYRQWGEACLSRLEGMFAFAIWDDAQRRLFCARDRLGIKPFYYIHEGGYFVFASEIKALLAFPGVQSTADDEAVLSFLVHGNCDYGERTVFRGIKALQASHCLSVDLRTTQCTPWSYYCVEPKSAPDQSDEERIEGLRELLLSTMRKHLISDVRIGSCLSGGLDSSALVALIGKIERDNPEAATAVGAKLYTFTSCNQSSEIDERKYAVAMADSVGANCELLFPSAQDFWADFNRLAWHQDMPFGSLSHYVQWRVMRAAKEAGVKVLIDGQGGDEVFGGYAKFRYAYLASLARSGRFSTFAREFSAMVLQGDRYVLDLRNGYRYLPKSLRGLLQIDSILKHVVKTDWGRIVSDLSTPGTRWALNVSGSNGRTGERPAGSTAMQRIQVDDILTDTLPQLLRFEDRSSMAFSIEARVPLLDHRLVEYGISLPDDLKVRGGWSKYALREAMRGLMPESVRLRASKLGFAAPDRLWLSQDLRAQVADFIGGDLRCQKYVDIDALRRWYGSDRAARSNTASYLGLFRIMSLEAWMRVFNVS